MTPRGGVGRGLDAWLFDLDGVLTDTATVHAAAWKETFDDLLRRRAAAGGFEAFGAEDYERFVDGKPRYDGVRDFLRSRGVVLPEGSRHDPPGFDTVCAVGNQKNERVLERLARGEVVVFPGSRALVRELRAAGVRTAVVSASENCRPVLRSGGIEDLFDVVVDGRVALERALAGKPAPDTYLAAAAELGVAPARAAVVEDALAGAEAGRAGRFGLVVGVARQAAPGELTRAGADVVVGDLAELLGGGDPVGPDGPDGTTNPPTTGGGGGGEKGPARG